MIDISLRVLLVMVMECRDGGAAMMAELWWTLKGRDPRAATTLMAMTADVWRLWSNHGVWLLQCYLVVVEMVVMKAWLLSLLFSGMSLERGGRRRSEVTAAVAEDGVSRMLVQVAGPSVTRRLVLPGLPLLQ